MNLDKSYDCIKMVQEDELADIMFMMLNPHWVDVGCATIMVGELDNQFIACISFASGMSLVIRHITKDKERGR